MPSNPALLPTSGGQAAAPAPPATPPLLVGHADARHLCGGLSAATWHRLLAAGRIGPNAVKLGGRVLFSVEELRQWVASGCPGRQEWVARRAAREQR